MAAAALPTDERVPLKAKIAIFGTMLGAFMAILDIQITNSSLNDILGTLNATIEEGSWIATAYLIAEIIVIPLTGWLASVFSARRVLVVCASLFIACSVGCGLAWNLSSMIFFRGLQGMAGGFLIPMAYATQLTMMPRSKQALGGALFGITATFAPAIGPTLGGWLTEQYGWPSIFYLNILPGFVLIACTWYAMPRLPIAWERLKSGDWWGIAAMAIGLASLEYVLEEGNRDDWFNSDLITRLAILSAVCLVVFIWRVLRSERPFINLRLLGRRNFGAGCMVAVSLGIGLYGSVYVLPIYLAMVQRYNALQIGEVIMWMGLPQLLILPLIPRLVQKIDPRWMLAAGMALFGVSCLMNAYMSPDTAIEQLKFSQLIRALGQPLIFVPLTIVTTAGIEPAQAGSASGLFNMLRNLGGSIGIAVLSTLLTRREHLHSARLGEAVSLYDPATQERLNQLTQKMLTVTGDPVAAQLKATAVLDLSVRRQAYMLAFNDCFLFIGGALLISLIAVFSLRKAQGAGGMGH